jgi:hypothetical protein
LKDKIDNRNEGAARLIEYDMAIRGAYLAYIIPIDTLIKDIISYHFCSDGDKRKQFVSVILNGKTTILFHLVSRSLKSFLGSIIKI